MYTLQLDETDINILWIALWERPHSQVRVLIDKINYQLKEQQTEDQPMPPQGEWEEQQTIREDK